MITVKEITKILKREKMQLKARFNEEDKFRVWIDHPFCAYPNEDGTECMSNKNCSIHHICSTDSDSIITSIMLCEPHHLEADCHNRSDKKYQSKLLRATLTYILTTDYNLTQKDLEFYISNKALYN
jgi:hypothetical protein